MAIYASMYLPSTIEPYLKSAVFDRALRALSDPTRLEIVELLGSQGGLFCSDICKKVMHLSQATVSHHLKQLISAGVLKSGRFGQKVFYDVDSMFLDLFLRDFRAKLKPPALTPRKRLKKL
jgi:ArsR family transcriptional regulator